MLAREAWNSGKLALYSAKQTPSAQNLAKSRLALNSPAPQLVRKAPPPPDRKLRSTAPVSGSSKKAAQQLAARLAKNTRDKRILSKSK